MNSLELHLNPPPPEWAGWPLVDVDEHAVPFRVNGKASFYDVLTCGHWVAHNSYSDHPFPRQRRCNECAPTPCPVSPPGSRPAAVPPIATNVLPFDPRRRRR